MMLKLLAIAAAVCLVAGQSTFVIKDVGADGKSTPALHTLTGVVDTLGNKITLTLSSANASSEPNLAIQLIDLVTDSTIGSFAKSITIDVTDFEKKCTTAWSSGSSTFSYPEALCKLNLRYSSSFNASYGQMVVILGFDYTSTTTTTSSSSIGTGTGTIRTTGSTSISTTKTTFRENTVRFYPTATYDRTGNTVTVATDAYNAYNKKPAVSFALRDESCAAAKTTFNSSKAVGFYMQAPQSEKDYLSGITYKRLVMQGGLGSRYKEISNMSSSSLTSSSGAGNLTYCYNFDNLCTNSWGTTYTLAIITVKGGIYSSTPIKSTTSVYCDWPEDLKKLGQAITGGIIGFIKASLALIIGGTVCCCVTLIVGCVCCCKSSKPSFPETAAAASGYYPPSMINPAFNNGGNVQMTGNF